MPFSRTLGRHHVLRQSDHPVWRWHFLLIQTTEVTDRRLETAPLGKCLDQLLLCMSVQPHARISFVYLFIYYMVYTQVKSFTIVKNRKCFLVSWHISLCCGPQRIVWRPDLTSATLSWQAYHNQRCSHCREFKNCLLHRDHVTPALWQLHWLPVDARVQFKLCTLMYGIHNSQCQSNMSDVVQLVATMSTWRGLRSAAMINYSTPRLRSKFGEHATPSNNPPNSRHKQFLTNF